MRPLHELELVGRGQDSQSPFVYESSVYRPQPSGKRRVRRNAERNRLAVHRPAGRHGEIGACDEALRVDGVFGLDHGWKPARSYRRALLARPRQHDDLRSRVRPDAVEHIAEERVPVPVIERDIRRSPNDDEHPLPVEPELVEDAGVGLEVAQVVLLLQAGVAAYLGRGRTEHVEPVLRDGIRNDDPAGSPAAQAVLHARELVVERVPRRDPERPRDEWKLVRRVGEREIELPCLGIAAERTQATCHRSRLADPACASVTRPDDVVLDVVEAQELDRLGVLARCHANLVSATPEQPDQGAKERHLGRVRDVDPDAHRCDPSRRSADSRPIVLLDVDKSICIVQTKRVLVNVPNPFRIAGELLRNEMIDRDAEAARLLALASGGHAARLVAPRRYGKTSLLRRVLTDASDSEWATALVDLEGVLSLSSVVVRIERAYDRSLRGAVRRTVDSLFRAWQVGLSLGAGGFTASLQANPRIDVESVLLRLLDLPAKLHDRTGVRSFVAFDEFQDLLRVDGADGMLRSVLQHQTGVASYAFAGSAPTLMERLFDDPSRPLLEHAVPVELDPLPLDETASYVEARFRLTGRDVGNALDPLLAFTRGHPQRSMLVAHHLWELVPDGSVGDESAFVEARDRAPRAGRSCLARAVGVTRGERATRQPRARHSHSQPLRGRDASLSRAEKGQRRPRAGRTDREGRGAGDAVRSGADGSVARALARGARPVLTHQE